jgi:hypothetical protein
LKIKKKKLKRSCDDLKVEMITAPSVVRSAIERIFSPVVILF